MARRSGPMKRWPRISLCRWAACKPRRRTSPHPSTPTRRGSAPLRCARNGPMEAPARARMPHAWWCARCLSVCTSCTACTVCLGRAQALHAAARHAARDANAARRSRGPEAHVAEQLWRQPRRCQQPVRPWPCLRAKCAAHQTTQPPVGASVCRARAHDWRTLRGRGGRAAHGHVFWHGLRAGGARRHHVRSGGYVANPMRWTSPGRRWLRAPVEQAPTCDLARGPTQHEIAAQGTAPSKPPRASSRQL